MPVSHHVSQITFILLTRYSNSDNIGQLLLKEVSMTTLDRNDFCFSLSCRRRGGSRPAQAAQPGRKLWSARFSSPGRAVRASSMAWGSKQTRGNRFDLRKRRTESHRRRGIHAIHVRSHVQYIDDERGKGFWWKTQRRSDLFVRWGWRRLRVQQLIYKKNEAG